MINSARYKINDTHTLYMQACMYFLVIIVKCVRVLSLVIQVRKAMCELYREHLNSMVSLHGVKLALY